MKSFSAICLILATCGILTHAQPAQVQVNADCVIQFNIATSGGTAPTSSGFDNRRIGCNSWQISYANNGFSAITLAIQEAPDNTGTPGAFGTLGGTATFGVNPNTNTTGASALIQSYGTNFAPWVRVALTSATGSGNVIGILLGFRAAGSAGTSSSGGGGTQNVNLLQVASVATVSDGNGGQVPGGLSTAMANAISNTQTIPEYSNAGTATAGVSRIFPFKFNGSTWDRDQNCATAKPTITNLSGSGNTQIFAGTAAQNIYICDMEFSTGTPEDFKLTEGTGANCASGTADATALMKNISAWSLTPGGGTTAYLITQTAGDSLCANQAGTQAAAVTTWAIKY